MSDQRKSVTNVVIAGLGGQGVVTASDILAEAAFRAGLDVKKSEIHGMSQRGGSVTSDVRFGAQVFSPMVPTGEADFLVVLEADELAANRHHLRAGGVLITPETVLGADYDVDDLDEDSSTPLTRRNLNVALLGALSAHLTIPNTCWQEAMRATLRSDLYESNLAVFELGHAAARQTFVVQG